MKKILYIILTLLLSNTSFSQNIPSYLPTNGLVGWWPFNGNANDLSGNGNNGSVNGATLSFDRFGLANRAYYFDGDSDFINVGNPSKLPNPPFRFSQSFWLNIPSWPNSSSVFNVFPIISKRHMNNGNDWATGRIEIDGKCYFFADDAFYQNYTPASSPVISINNWHHFVLVKDSSFYKIYMNGILVSSVLDNHQMSGSNNNILFGAHLAWNMYFKGKLDDIGIWNRALTDLEISDLYNGCNFSNVSIIPSGNTTICQGDSIKLNAGKTNPTFNYTWYFNNLPINGAYLSSYFAKQQGSYSIKIDSGNCSAKSTPVNLNVNSLPNVKVTIEPYINIQRSSFSLSATPIGGTFSGSGVSTNGIFNPYNASLGTKTIYYTFTDANNCTNIGVARTLVFDTISCLVNDTIRVSVMDTLKINIKLTGLAPPNNFNTLMVYPNPANTHITIDYGYYFRMSGYTLKIINSMGQTIYTTSINQQQTNIDLSDWNGNGIYFLQVIDSTNNVIENKVIILQ